MAQISTIINYCTHDYRFLRHCIESALKLSSEVIVSVCSHFFNGEEENQALLYRSYKEHPNVKFIEFAYDQRPYGLYSPLTYLDEDWNHYWHSTARYVGFHFIKECDYILFLDVDEIIEVDRFLEWLCYFPITHYSALRFSSYFYFREPQYRAIDVYPLNALLVRKEAIHSPEIILDIYERKGLYDQIKGPKLSHISGQDQRPFVHHYSWVRTLQEVQHKVRTWGHLHDKEWLQLIEKEWTHPFMGKEQIHGFQYETITPLHDVLRKIEHQNTLETVFPHVTKINRSTLFEINIKALL